jgi:hypothetical protein
MLRRCNTLCNILEAAAVKSYKFCTYGAKKIIFFNCSTDILLLTEQQFNIQKMCTDNSLWKGQCERTNAI